MKTRRLLSLALAVLIFSCASFPATAALVTEAVPYADGDTQLQGYYVYDDAAKAPLPAVVVVHEWWGLNDYIRARAEQLAALGYAVFAVDMYGGGAVATTVDEAATLSSPFYGNRDLMRQRARAGIAALKTRPQVDAARLAAVGYSFGGAVSLELARVGEDLKGVVAFYAGLATPAPAEKGAITAPLLVLNGGADPMSAAGEKNAFAAEMDAAGADVTIIDYPGAKHGFTNPAATELGEKTGLALAYDEDADKKSFAEMTVFLQEVMSPMTPAFLQP